MVTTDSVRHRKKNAKNRTKETQSNNNVAKTTEINDVEDEINRSDEVLDDKSLSERLHEKLGTLPERRSIVRFKINVMMIVQVVKTVDILLFQGDGESLPETPPNENLVETKTAATSATSPNTAQKDVFVFSVNVDGMAVILLFLGILTRFASLDQPRNVV